MQQKGELPRPLDGQNETIDNEYLATLRTKLEQPDYMSVAVQSLARELTIELMEKTYGIPFR